VKNEANGPMKTLSKNRFNSEIEADKKFLKQGKAYQTETYSKKT